MAITYKSALISIVILLSYISACAQSQPEIQWDDKGASQYTTTSGVVVVESAIDYGTVKLGDESAADATFGFTNVGGAALVISDCHPSYDYVTTGSPVTAIQPGEHGTITVHYDVNRPGEFIIYVYLQSNAINGNGYQVLAIHGTVVA